MMADLFASGRIADLILALVLVEGLALVVWRRRTGRGPAPLDVVSGLFPGACLMLALRAALVGAWWGWAALALAASGLAHVLDLRRRWPGRRPR